MRTKKARRQRKRRYSPSSLTHHVSGTIRGLRRPRVAIDPELRWYVLVTAPQKERQVADELTRDGLAAYVPLMVFEVVRRGKRIQREKLPVGRYLFAGLPEGREPSFGLVEAVTGVLGASGEPVAIAPDALQAFSDVLTGYRPDLAQEFDGRFVVGDEVRVTEGPFRGHVAEIDSLLWTGNVRALVRLLGRMTPVDISTLHLEAA